MAQYQPGRGQVATLRLWVAAILFLASLLAVMPAQTYNLWRASVVGAEWGHYLALAALLMLLIPGWTRTVRGQLSGALAVVALSLALSPSVRAMGLGAEVGGKLEQAFGKATVRSLDGAPSRARAFTFGGYLKKPASPSTEMKTLIYATRAEKPLEMDLYRRNFDSTKTGASGHLGTPAPIVVTIHGGSWVTGSRAELPELNRYLASRGYIVAAIEYRLAPEHPFPAATEDVNAAIDYLKKHARALGADSTRIALIGRSAGGQLALQSAYTKHDPSIKGVAALYSPTDQQWGWDHPANPHVYDSFAALRTFLHGEPSQVPELFRESSPINHIGPDAVPTLLIHGSMDPLVSVKQSQRLDSALAASHRPHLLVELPWATHGCDYVFNGPCGQISTFAIERFLGSVLR